MILLLIQDNLTDPAWEGCALEDKFPRWRSIGYWSETIDNPYGAWHFPGWDWSNDVFTFGEGEVVGWHQIPAIGEK